VLHSGRAVTAPVIDLTDEDHDFVGLPGLLSAEQTAALLASRDAHVKQRTVIGAPERRTDVAALRKEVAGLAAQVAGRSGTTPRTIHVEARKAVPGPPSAQAPADVLSARRDWLLGRL